MGCNGVRGGPSSLSLTVTVLALTVTACSGGNARSIGSTGEVSDSAGVELVANQTGGVWTADKGWSVQEVLSIGGASADSIHQFGKISGIGVDGSGEIYVADVLARNVRVFGPSGAYVRTIGHPGSGPGEFGSNVAGVFVVDDQLLVPDLANQRVSRFDQDGIFVSDSRLDMSRGIPIRFDLDAGSQLIAERRLIVPGDSVARAGDPIVTVVPDREQVDTVTTLGLGRACKSREGFRRFEHSRQTLFGTRVRTGDW